MLLCPLRCRHGTHVSGIIAAKTNGKGVVGVVPGMPVHAFKVIDASGSGQLSNVMKAFDAILAMLQQGQKVVVVNISLAFNNPDNPNGPPSKANRDAICGYMQAIAAYGTIIGVAAGECRRVIVNLKFDHCVR